MNRDCVVKVIAWLSGIAAIASLGLALFIRFRYPCLMDMVGYPVVGAWVLLPPVWFLAEWVFLCKGMCDKERERIVHLHELARNIWVALVVVLAVIFGIDFKQ